MHHVFFIFLFLFLKKFSCCPFSSWAKFASLSPISIWCCALLQSWKTRQDNGQILALFDVQPQQLNGQIRWNRAQRSSYRELLAVRAYGAAITSWRPNERAPTAATVLHFLMQ